jgi:ABC-2 type transport system permease protein
MNTMKWLVKREFWEHKGGFFWAPVWVGGIWTILIAGTIFLTAALGTSHGFNINGTTVNSLSSALSPADQKEAADALAASYMGFSLPVFAVLAITVFFFCIGSLYDDRRDRSVLFWKSLPISDSETVLSKVIIGIVVAPLIATALAAIVSLLLLLAICVTSAFMGVNVFGAILLNAHLYLSPLAVIGILPVYAVWALPTIGWLMLVSAWARTMPFLWAVGIPLFSGFLLSFFNAIFSFGWHVEWFWKHIVGRGLGGTIPGIWFAYFPAPTLDDTIVHGANGVSVHRHADNMGAMIVQTWHVFATPDIWIGAVVGAAMIYAAIRLRRWRDEG